MNHLAAQRPGLLAAALLFLASAGASAQEAGAPAPDFATCLDGLQRQALAQGRDADLVNTVVPTLERQDRVLELDRRQPEFVQTFGRYLAVRVNETRIENGRTKYRQQAQLLQRLRDEYGVPGHYLVAFWGLETNYGSYLGTMPTLDSLATLACDPRRSEFFTSQFLTALELMERESLSASDMQGSWAGAVGHTQFMPSNYLRYAVDGDGDGRIDLWGSEADALASGAHFLQRLGWTPGLRWGREVQLPDGFDYALAGTGDRRTLRTWATEGVRRTDGSALPVADVEAALLVPAGADGPAFLVYENFNVIMGWNRSESYALSVGLLADRIAGGGELARPPPNDEALRISEVEAIQRALTDRGFDPGPVDGLWGPATRQALAAFEASTGRTADGYPDPDVIGALIGDRHGAEGP